MSSSAAAWLGVQGQTRQPRQGVQQLLQYREALHNPPLLVVSDIDTIVVHPNFVNRANRPTTITLDDLLTPAGVAALHAIFTDSQHFESPETPESVTRRGRFRTHRRPAASGRHRRPASPTS